MLRQLFAAIAAGIMIAIGGCVYLASPDKVVGALFFSVALISICMKGYGLFTGRVGYFVGNHTRAELSGLLMTLAGNAIATLLLGAAVGGALTSLGAAADASVAAKLAAPWYATLLRAVLCGVLMYLAVSIYREKNTALGIVFCVPTFILAGFEHSIADMFYVAAALEFSFPALGFLALVIVGNAIGGMLMPLLALVGAEKKEAKK